MSGFCKILHEQRNVLIANKLPDFGKIYQHPHSCSRFSEVTQKHKVSIIVIGMWLSIVYSYTDITNLAVVHMLLQSISHKILTCLFLQIKIQNRGMGPLRYIIERQTVWNRWVFSRALKES